ncbi:MAG: DEAD/DEAH box helicase [Gammaproteobacteria bacterium]|nr:DEAD/DEAH box helicase [Pseudomonadales bacterium]MCP5330360.1 DEAD/DEAH box helicase [Pseudomonadales bacterium]
MSSSPRPELSFAELDLPHFLQETLSKVGYEKPSPIQQATIPVLLQGRDVVGMAQTGTGKTAAFALPILSRIDLSVSRTQALVLCPTRELAIQVAEAFQTYAAGMKGFHVLPIYGGQDMGRQLAGLRRGPHVVVGTPGRLLDHLRRKTIDLGHLQTLVLDEADEMLRMGFIDDVEAILETTPETRQVALFSATMPGPIRAVAEKYLRDPQEIRIQSAITTNEDIEQFYWLVQGTNKLDALTRILEVEDFDAMIIFVRTKTSTVDLAEKLSARGFAASALNGDMNQAIRTRTVEMLKNGQLDILVATDVAARGLDVERVSHVMNYDIPYDDEAYVHRIGRTGRAGRSGKAILFVAPRERRLLYSIEKTTRKKIEQMSLPTRGELIEKRSAAFKEGIIETVRNGKLDFFHQLVSELVHECECPPEDIAAAMAYLLQKDRPLEPAAAEEASMANKRARTPPATNTERKEGPRRKAPRHTSGEEFEHLLLDEDEGRAHRPRMSHDPSEDSRARPLKDYPEIPMERFRIQVGHRDGLSPREVVGAVANEAEIEGRYIGHIRIYDEYSTVDLPAGMPREVMQLLQKTVVCGKPLKLESATQGKRPSREKTEVSAPGTKSEKRPVRAPKPGFDKAPASGRKEQPEARVKREKKSGYEGNDKPARGKPGAQKPARSRQPFTDSTSRDITREVLEQYPELEAPGFRKAPGEAPGNDGERKARKVKPRKERSKRVNKDKGKRRVPKAKSPQE